MPNGSTISLFVAAALLLVMMPGPNTLYIIARSIQQGFGAGVVSSLGIQVGTICHAVAAAFGVSAVLMSSALAFSVLKYAGAAYLIYLGVRTLLAQAELSVSQAVEPKNLGRVFYQGCVVNLLNPKTGIFMFAFLPQFVDGKRGAPALQVLVLAGILCCVGFMSDMIYAISAGGLGNWLRGNLKFLRVQRYFAATVYIGLGAAMALTGANNNH
jgi:threonine/homoserine/homoserine lactone efflux protein